MPRDEGRRASWSKNNSAADSRMVAEVPGGLTGGASRKVGGRREGGLPRDGAPVPRHTCRIAVYCKVISCGDIQWELHGNSDARGVGLGEA